ncbi:MAG: ABC transporter permease [Rickettsiales bacterium]|nr:ABC transporter permease [Rickettsiales bacterium]
MNILKLVISHLRFKLLNNVFNVTILAIGVAMVVVVIYLGNQINNKFDNDFKNIDLVVGAKGSPMQLILSSLLHMDAPNGNISFEEANKLATNPLIKSAIPIALGDNYNGFRIVGTNLDYVDHYEAVLLSGSNFNEEMEVVIGSEVARKGNLSVGDKIAGSHGLVEGGDVHDDLKYEVVGILKQNNSAIDRLVLTPIESLWRVHEHEEGRDDGGDHHEKEITALLINYKTPMAIMSVPRMINMHSNMLAASPALELTRLINFFGIGSDAIKIFAIIFIFISAIGFFITLLNSIDDRYYDISLMRILGASREKILTLILFEGLILGSAGSIFGIILGHGFIVAIVGWLDESKNIILSHHFGFYEIYVFFISVLISIGACIIPSIIAYRLNIVKILSKK